MTSILYYSANEVYGETYYQLPKVFFTNERYIKLSNDAKIAFAILKDRFSYSIKNNWVDEQNHIYFIYTNRELMEILNYSEKKIISIKKELEKANLLFQKRIGLNKPNRLYLGKPNADAQDVYLQSNNQQHLDTSGTVNNTVPINEPQSLDTSGTVNNTVPVNEPQSFDTSGTVNNTANLYKYNYLDTNRHLIDSDKDELQEKLLLENFVELNSNSQRVNATFVPDNVLKLIQTFSPSYSVAQTTAKTIHNAKYKAEQVAGIKIAYEELDDYIANPDQGLYNTVLRAYQKQKTEEVKDMQNVIFTYVKNWFVEYPIQAKKAATENSDLPKVTLHNYLE